MSGAMLAAGLSKWLLQLGPSAALRMFLCMWEACSFRSWVHRRWRLYQICGRGDQ